MARTYYAEGRNVAKFVSGVCLLSSMSIYFFVLPGLHWGFFFVFVFGSVLAGEIAGAAWVRKRREAKSSTKSKSKSQVTALKANIRKTHKPLTDDELIHADVDTLSGKDFERLMAMYYRDQGYQVELVGGSGDHEVDLILKGKEGYKIAVQCKRWKQDVGNDIVLRLHSGKRIHNCYDAWIITTSNFTPAAREAAEKLNITLINGLIVRDRLNRWKQKKRTNVR